MEEDRFSFLSDVTAFVAESKTYLNDLLSSLNWSECNLFSNDNVKSGSSSKNDVSQDDLVRDESDLNVTEDVKNDIKMGDVLNDIVEDLPMKVVKKDETLLDILARERDMKRRRISYKGKVHTKHKSPYEILREVIAQQMETLEESCCVQAPSESKDDRFNTQTNPEQSKMIDFSRVHGDNPHLAWKYVIRELKHKGKNSDLTSQQLKYKRRSQSRDNDEKKYIKHKEEDNHKKRDNIRDSKRDRDVNNRGRKDFNNSYTCNDRYEDRERSSSDKIKNNTDRDRDILKNKYNNITHSKESKKIYNRDHLEKESVRSNGKNSYYKSSSSSHYRDSYYVRESDKTSVEDLNRKGEYSKTLVKDTFCEGQSSETSVRKTYCEEKTSDQSKHHSKIMSKYCNEDYNEIRSLKRSKKNSSSDKNEKNNSNLLINSNQDSYNDKYEVPSKKYSNSQSIDKDYSDVGQVNNCDSLNNHPNKSSQSPLNLMTKEFNGKHVLESNITHTNIREPYGSQMSFRDSTEGSTNKTKHRSHAKSIYDSDTNFNGTSLNNHTGEDRDVVSNTKQVDVAHTLSSYKDHRKENDSERRTAKDKCKRSCKQDEHKERKHNKSLEKDSGIGTPSCFKETDRLLFESSSGVHSNTLNSKLSSSDDNSLSDSPDDRSKRKKKEKQHCKKSKKRREDNDKHLKKKKRKRSRSKDRRKKHK